MEVKRTVPVKLNASKHYTNRTKVTIQQFENRTHSYQSSVPFVQRHSRYPAPVKTAIALKKVNSVPSSPVV